MNGEPEILEVEKVDDDGIIVIFADGRRGRVSATLLASITPDGNPSTSLAMTIHLSNELEKLTLIV